MIDWLLRPGGEDFRAKFYSARDGDVTIGKMKNLILIFRSIFNKSVSSVPLISRLTNPGFGHDCTKKKDCSKIKAPITRAQGMVLFKEDIGTAESCVGHTKNADKLNINRSSALASFAYNAGCGGFADSLGNHLKSGDLKGLSAAFPTAYITAGPKGHRKKLPGLVTRRKHEQSVFNTPSKTLSVFGARANSCTRAYASI